MDKRIPDTSGFSDCNYFEHKKLKTKYQILVVQWLQLFTIQKVSEVENKTPDHAYYITTQEFNKLPARSKQANLLRKIDFDNKLISFNRKTTSNKTKYLEAQKYPSSLKKRLYLRGFFLG